MYRVLLKSRLVHPSSSRWSAPQHRDMLLRCCLPDTRARAKALREGLPFVEECRGQWPCHGSQPSAVGLASAQRRLAAVQSVGSSDIVARRCSSGQMPGFIELSVQ